MLSASILGYSLFHSMGDAKTFFDAYLKHEQNQQVFSYDKILEPPLHTLSTLLPKANLRRVPK